MFKHKLTGLAGALVLLFATSAGAGVITNGSLSAGIAANGNIFDGGIGVRRTSDGLDVIRPGTPREGWGVSAGATSGWADPSTFGISNIVANGAAVFGAATASTSSFLNSGGGNLLQIDQAFSFAAANVLRIDITIDNISGASQAVRFSRQVDWDVPPTDFSETITLDPLTGQLTDSSYYGFESPDPLVAFSSSGGAGGGTFGPGDLGTGLLLDFGSLAAGDDVSFSIFHALNTSAGGQSEAALRTQLYGLGVQYVATGIGAATNVAAFGYAAASVPEPGTLVLLGLSLAGLGFARRRKAAG